MVPKTELNITIYMRSMWVQMFMISCVYLGKTFTMVGADGGNSQSLGIIPCAISWLYRMIGEMRSKSGARFSLRVSALEVSGPQEQLRDLLQEYASGKSQFYSFSVIMIRKSTQLITQKK